VDLHTWKLQRGFMAIVYLHAKKYMTLHVYCLRDVYHKVCTESGKS